MKPVLEPAHPDINLAQQTPVSTAFVATRNACKMCTPLGACLAFTGVAGAMPLLHGSQGCSTYIRRYLISHFREPMDIASSNFSEQSAIFGGDSNLATALTNLIDAYHPSMIGVCTTCLSETIGDDVKMFLHGYQLKWDRADAMPPIVHASTPSYAGSHTDGYHAALRAIVSTLVKPIEKVERSINLIPAMLSPADLRYLREIMEDFKLSGTLLPDYADRMDGPSWADYQRIPPGGTTLTEITHMGGAALTVQMSATVGRDQLAGAWLEDHCQVPLVSLGIPLGVQASDAFFKVLEGVSGNPTPQHHQAERGRLLDSYVDAHKYLFGKRVVIFGDEDLVAALAGFAHETGMKTVLVASGGRSGVLSRALAQAMGVTHIPGDLQVLPGGADFEQITEVARQIKPDLLLGNSKGYKLAQELGVPLVRVGLPIHDRVGASRLLHLGYRGTQQLFDRVVNAILEHRQESSDVVFTYM